MKGDDHLHLADLVANPSDPFILDSDWDDPEEDVEVWWATPLTPEHREQIARNRES